MNKYDQKSSTGPAQTGDTTRPNKKDTAQQQSQGTGQDDNDAQEVTDNDVIKKPSYTPSPKDPSKNPTLRAAKGDDEVMSQPPKQS